MELVDELIKAIDIPGAVACTVPEVQKWKRPEESWLKVNCDGALNSQEKLNLSDCAGSYWWLCGG
jgi:hypothetical protein